MEILRLKEVMKTKGITGKELAARVEVTPASISNIVQGNSFPKPELLMKISEVLDVDIRELFYQTKDRIDVNGFIEYQGRVHRIKSITELKEITRLVSIS